MWDDDSYGYDGLETDPVWSTGHTCVRCGAKVWVADYGVEGTSLYDRTKTGGLVRHRCNRVANLDEFEVL